MKRMATNDVSVSENLVAKIFGVSITKLFFINVASVHFPWRIPNRISRKSVIFYELIETHQNFAVMHESIQNFNVPQEIWRFETAPPPQTPSLRGQYVQCAYPSKIGRNENESNSMQDGAKNNWQISNSYFNKDWVLGFKMHFDISFCTYM